MAIIYAVYENGVFRPLGAVSLPEGCKVELRIVEPLIEPHIVEAPNAALQRAIAWAESLKNRTDEEIEEARRQLAAHSPPLRPIPEGKTLEDMVMGTWPGDETDEQINEALRKLS